MDSIDTLASAGYDRSIKLFKGSAAAADPPVRQQELTASILSFLSKDLVFTYGPVDGAVDTDGPADGPVDFNAMDSRIPPLITLRRADGMFRL